MNNLLLAMRAMYIERNTTVTFTTPTDKVLSSAEIMEAILVHLPMQDIHLVQRVSKTWKATIRASPKLQNKLYFQHAGKSMREFERENRTERKPKIIILDDYPDHETIFDPEVVLTDGVLTAKSGDKISFNPILNKLFSWYEMCLDTGEAHDKYFVYDSTLELFKQRWPDLPPWRNMQLAQPSLSSVIVAPTAGNLACLFAEQYGGRMFHDVCYQGLRVERQDGLRVGDLCHALHMILRRHRKMLKWHNDNGLLVRGPLGDLQEEGYEDEELVEFRIELESR